MNFIIQRILTSLHNIGAGLALSVGALVAVLAAEVVFLGYRKSSLHLLTRPAASARRDMLSFVLDVTGVLRILGHVATLGAAYLFGLFVNRKLNLNLTGVFADPVAQVAFWLLAKSFLDYWMHRFMHKVPMLWEIHKYHHSAAEFHVVTAHRESILVAPWSSLYFAIPLGILGTPTTVFIAVAFLVEAHALLVHSQFRFSWGRAGDWLLISPRAHRIHHSLDKRHWGRNYSFTFSFWDHLFGTYYKGEVPAEIHVGVTNAPYNSVNWVREMAYSMKACGNEFMNMVRGIPSTMERADDGEGAPAGSLAEGLQAAVAAEEAELKISR